MVYALVVLYNKKCSDSITINSIIHSELLNVIVFDNSTSNYNNKEYCEKNGIIYYGFGKNIGLSRAYNYVISKLKKTNNDFIMILDDDTKLNGDYFSEVFLKIKNDSCDVFLPIVKTNNNQILSPSFINNFGRVCSFLEDNIKLCNNITAINSGMVIRLSVFKKLKYDEDLFLDCVDHSFLYSVKENHYKICIMKKAAIYQTYSRNEMADKEKVLSRFNIFKKDFSIYSKKYKINKLYCFLSICKLRIKYFFVYKSFAFFR